ncbi:hypothetical protein [Atlantibacter hermannii]|uniref:hypothetical protein n=1 Tax=Atlantibacter hermannii TaxID=565 RepID=UPI002FDAFA73
MTENNKHLVRVGHEFAAAMSDETPIITIAKMVTELASALDVQSARSDALAAALKASEANDADARCHVAELEAKCAALAGENAALIGFDADEFSYNGPYQPDDAVLEKLKTPATDAWVNEQRAVGATRVETNLRACYEEFPESSRDIVDECIQIAANTAAQLRGSQV